jgi:hypothetical protein
MKISLIGSRKHGKDYNADIIQKEFALHRLAWADNVKQFCEDKYPFLSGLNTPELKDKVISKINKSPRDLWNETSKEYGEEYFFDVNIDFIKDKSNIIITDTRNKREFDFLEKNNYLNILIVRPGYPQFEGYDSRIEEFVDEIKHVFINDGKNDIIEFINDLIDTNKD